MNLQMIHPIKKMIRAVQLIDTCGFPNWCACNFYKQFERALSRTSSVFQKNGKLFYL